MAGRALTVETRQTGPHFAQLHEQLGSSQLAARILSSRGIESIEELDLGLANLRPPNAIPGIEVAAFRVIQAIAENEKIVIAGDYDVDGATSTALCASFLEAVGHTNFLYRVPNRRSDGYGLSPSFMNSLIEEDPSLVITVDNGVSSVEGIELANEHDIDVVVTDHHLAPDTLPDAVAIVNPNLPSSEFEGQLAGVGVAFYLMAVVLTKLKDSGHFTEKGIDAFTMVEWLDLVAVGTIADLVPLDYLNRVLVNEGLNRIRAGRVRPGLVALCEVSNVGIEKITSENIGFQIAPRINASGRLDDISVGIQTLLETNERRAADLALQLDKINRERRSIQEDMTYRADVINRLDKNQKDQSRCIYDASFHEGIVGLVASNVVRDTGLPTVVFADAEEEEIPLVKGSARSVAGVHIRDVLADIDTQYPHLMIQFGGHAMAAGLTIKRANLSRFMTLFNDSIKRLAGEGAFDGLLKSDGELTEEEFSLATLDELDRFGPWGQGFPPPVFHGTFEVVHQTVFSEGRHVRLALRKGDRYIQAVAFSQSPVDADRVFIVYQLNRNDWGGEETLQLIVQHMAPAG